MRRFPKVRDGVFRLVFLVFVIYRFSVSYVRLRWRLTITYETVAFDFVVI